MAASMNKEIETACASHHEACGENWAEIHSPEVSWRKKLIGEISDVFVVPRYVKLFYDNFGSMQNASFVEIGSGNGDLPRAILNCNKGQIGRYIVSEQFPQGVEWLKSQGLDAIQADAVNLPVGDGSFDASIAFDVMHHVPQPALMAKEMMRVARGRCLLVESNGMSIFRKLKELTPAERAAGERSYSPWRYKSFFTQHPNYVVEEFAIYPFLFPFKCPGWFLPLLVRFNHAIENIPFFRWQCSSVAISVRYRRK
jgi:hypothetical protein